jgi:hypothetical protein
MLLKKRLLLILTVAALMVATMAASAMPAFALNPQPIPPGVHGDYAMAAANIEVNY